MKVTFKKILAVALIFSSTSLSAREVYKCNISGVISYQHSPCKNKKNQKVACVSGNTTPDFKDKLNGSCTDINDDDNYGSGGSSYSGYYNSSNYRSSNRSLGSGGNKSQHVSGYTRSNGTHVNSYMRSSRR